MALGCARSPCSATWTQDVVRSSSIQGRIVASDQARSSIAHRLDLDPGGLMPGCRTARRMRKRSRTIGPVLQADLTHLWFVTIHPFNEGNRRCARTIADLALARSEPNPERFFESPSDPPLSSSKGGCNPPSYLKNQWVAPTLQLQYGVLGEREQAQLNTGMSPGLLEDWPERIRTDWDVPEANDRHPANHLETNGMIEISGKSASIVMLFRLPSAILSRYVVYYYRAYCAPRSLAIRFLKAKVPRAVGLAPE